MASTTSCRHAFSRALSWASPEVFGLLLPDRQRNAGRGRRGNACSLCTTRRAGRRPVDPRARLRMGLAHPVDGPALSAFAYHRGVQFGEPAPAYRGELRGAWHPQCQCDHRGCQHTGTGAGQFDRCVSVEMFRAHAQLRSAAVAHLAVAAPGRQAVRPHLRPPHPHVSLRDRWRRRLDGQALLHRWPDAGVGYLVVVPEGPGHRRPLARGRYALPAHR